MRWVDSLFSRLFGGAIAAIILAHLLAFMWFTYYGPPHPPRDEIEFAEQHAQPHGEPGMPGEREEMNAPQGEPGAEPGSERRLDEYRRHRRPPIFGGPLVPLVFQLITLVLAAWYGAKALSRPIQRISEAAERLSENLDSPPLSVEGPREARQAAMTFNIMQQRIREQVQQRGRMLAAVSHDLRTPLSRLKLRVEQIDNEKLHGQMTQDLDDMISMLDATLTYLHEQRTAEALQFFDLQALIESLTENAQDHGGDVQTHGHCAPLRVQPMALRSCLNNLIDNALRYAGAVAIDIRDSAQRVQIRVIDHGPGISPEQREAVFEPFFRVEGSRNRNSGGVGLGMTIARDAARRMGGEIALEDTPGGGLTVVMDIPRV